MFNPERFAIRLMVGQAVLFSMETALVHYLGQALSIVQFGAVRGLGGVLTSMFFARTLNIFRTEQFRLHLIRGITALTYGWVLVYSFGQLPLADATAISYTQTIWIALLSLLILHETISRLRWLSVVVGVTGALLIAKPSFAALGVVYLVALFGTSLNALNFVLNAISRTVKKRQWHIRICSSFWESSVVLFVHLSARHGDAVLVSAIPVFGAAWDVRRHRGTQPCRRIIARPVYAVAARDRGDRRHGHLFRAPRPLDEHRYRSDLPQLCAGAEPPKMARAPRWCRLLAAGRCEVDPDRETAGAIF